MRVMRRYRFLVVFVATVSAAEAGLHADDEAALIVTARSRAEGTSTEERVPLEPKKTAIVVCDMWDKHWCAGASRRVVEMAARMNDVVKAARKRGVFVIHAPSNTMDHYKDAPQRRLALAAPKVDPKVELKRWCHLDKEREGELPIDDSDDGCDCQPRCEKRRAWTKQIDTVEIAEGDAITDSAEAYYLIQQRGIDNVIVLGVHANMCVLGRPFSIRQMVYQGKNVFLMRDMTDTMYNSRRAPFVSHFRGTDLVVKHIEKSWCPTITSADFLGGAPFRFKNDVRPHVVFMVGEREYDTKTTVPAFATDVLESYGFDCTFVHVSARDPNDFPGLEVVNEADLLFVSVRRRTPSKAQLALVRKHIDAGKPVVGIRTASHAFDRVLPDDKHASWSTFDRDVFGAHYAGHFSKADGQTSVGVVAERASHPVLTGVATKEFQVSSTLYKTRDVVESATTLLVGRLEGRKSDEAVAWVNEVGERRAFYTSLGGPSDFALEPFRRLLFNGILWTLRQPIPRGAR